MHQKVWTSWFWRGNMYAQVIFMAWYIIFSFCIFVIVDYIYIYNFLDSRVLLTSSGSKLKNSQATTKYKADITLEQFVCLAVVSCILFFLNFVIVYGSLNSNFLEITIFSHTINIPAMFENKYIIFKALYYVSSMICIYIMCFTYKAKIFEVLKKVKSRNEYDISSTPSAEDKLFFLGAFEKDTPVFLKQKAMYQNMLITGSIGSGKTSGAICNITESLIQRGIGGVILDAKGSFISSVRKMCKKAGREDDLQVVGVDSKYYFELLDQSVSPQELANRLRHVIELLSPNNNSDTYWLDKVENVFLNLIILMDFYGTRNMHELHLLVTSKEYLEEKLVYCKEQLLKEPPKDKTAFEMTNAILFLKEEYLNLDSRVFSIITSEITRLTIPLVTDYDIYRQFISPDTTKEKIDFYSTSNKIVILSINIGENKALCKIISVFLKLSFQKYILSTLKNPQKIPTFFIADEYQEFVNKDDSDFLSLSREAKCINIISTQSYSSIKNALRDDNAAFVIIQNFVNKVWFRNDDNFTNGEVVKQLGKTVVRRENTSVTENAQESVKKLLGNGFKNRKSSLSSSINYVLTKENEYDENFFSRELKTHEALAFIQNTEDELKPIKVKFRIWGKEDYVEKES